MPDVRQCQLKAFEISNWGGNTAVRIERDAPQIDVLVNDLTGERLDMVCAALEAIQPKGIVRAVHDRSQRGHGLIKSQCDRLADAIAATGALVCDLRDAPPTEAWKPPSGSALLNFCGCVSGFMSMRENNKIVMDLENYDYEAYRRLHDLNRLGKLLGFRQMYGSELTPETVLRMGEINNMVSFYHPCDVQYYIHEVWSGKLEPGELRIWPIEISLWRTVMEHPGVSLSGVTELVYGVDRASVHEMPTTLDKLFEDGAKLSAIRFELRTQQKLTPSRIGTVYIADLEADRAIEEALASSIIGPLEKLMQQSRGCLRVLEIAPDFWEPEVRERFCVLQKEWRIKNK